MNKKEELRSEAQPEKGGGAAKNEERLVHGERDGAPLFERLLAIIHDVKTFASSGWIA